MSASFIFVAGILNIGVWRHAKYLKMFDPKKITLADDYKLTEVSRVCDKVEEPEKSKI